ncbi:MAG TPA: ABC transporter permease, partial [Actinomycetota bacterium]|nr:ABC transporter permease [Actinomycetota bacterium]
MNSAGDLVTPGVQPIMVRRGHPVLLFVARRVVAAAATLVIVSILVFMGTEVLPGDAAGAVLGRSATPAQVEEMRELMGLDRPAHQRYLDWLGGLLSGDLGNSAAGFAAGGVSPIWDEISGKIGNSFALAGITAALMIPLSLLLGVIAAVRAGRALDHAISISSLAIIMSPNSLPGTTTVPGSSTAACSWVSMVSSRSVAPIATVPSSVASIR